jgi:hypothetical protein
MQHLSNGLHDCTIYSKIYLIKGYHQILVAEEEIPKTAIIMPSGLFEYLFTPFGLSNAAQTFQRMMDRTIDGLGCLPTWMTLASGLQIGKCNLSVRKHFLQHWPPVVLPSTLGKCVFAVPTLKHLGHTFSAAD